MAEQTFRSPGFFENEIDLAARDAAPQGVPAGIIGTAEKGPAFVPVTLGSVPDFTTRFGSLSPERFGPYAVNEWFKSRGALTYMRVLGAGSNSSQTHFADTKNFGIVKNAGFVISGGRPPGATGDNARAHEHVVQFITARHNLANTDGGEMFGYPMFTDNDSFVEEVSDKVNLVRGVLFTTTGSRFELLSNGVAASTSIEFTGETAANATIIINDGFGKTRTYLPAGGNDAENLQFNRTAGQQAAGLKLAIDNASGHGGDIITSVDGNTITLTNKRVGAAGNQDVGGVNQANMTIANTSKFAGGVNNFFEYNVHKPTFTTPGDFLNAASSKYKDAQSYFKLVLSTSAGETFGKDEGNPGVRILTASLEPTDPYYIGRILNTDPKKFYQERHLLYLDFAVESELAKVDTAAGSIALMSGSANSPGDISPKSFGDRTLDASFMELFGRFDTRYTTPKTPNIISQPFGTKEHDLFHFETVSDGEWGNSKFKVSIANVRASTDPRNPYGTFEVQLRNFNDTDKSPQILEAFPNCTLNPHDERYVAKQIGDYKVRWNHDAENPAERRLVVKGKHPNRSHRFRIVMNQGIEDGNVPKNALPFGFRGMEVLRTSDSLTDKIDTNLFFRDGAKAGVLAADGGVVRIQGDLGGSHQTHKASIIPPLPFRFKVTKDAVENVGAGAGGGIPAADKYVGRPGQNERVDSRFYWGVKTTRLPITASLPAGEMSDAVLRSNDSSDLNPLVKAYTKMHGIGKMGTLITGSAADEFNDNKFTLARVALENSLGVNKLETVVTGTSRQHMLQAVYVRNGHPNSTNYTITDRSSFKTDRITMATLVNSSSVIFNRFTEYCKFTTVFQGGFDGTNILSRDGYYMTDKAASSDPGGHALDVPGGDCYQGLAHLVAGAGGRNSVVSSFKTATRIMTDPTTVRLNLLAIPGMRDPDIVSDAQERVKDYGLAMYVMDLRNYDQDTKRLYDDSKKKPDVRITAEQFEGEAIDSNYSATYFPDVYIRDEANNRPVKVPASVAAISALGFNDRVGFPWFAPAGFNRGSLASVTNVHTRLSSADRDELYDVRINPIAVFPTGRFVIFGQKTLQQAKSALDRVNVRRLLLEVKRRVSGIARKLLFEANDAQTRARFVGEVAPQLATIQGQQGVERFAVVCDGTNNTSVDEEENRMNGRIVIVPTLAVEFIALDFIVTSAGVSFE